jgi:DNA primase
MSPKVPGPSDDTAATLIAARAALARHDWQAAYDASNPPPTSDLDPLSEADLLEVRAEAAWWLGRLDD